MLTSAVKAHPGAVEADEGIDAGPASSIEMIEQGLQQPAVLILNPLTPADLIRVTATAPAGQGTHHAPQA